MRQIKHPAAGAALVRHFVTAMSEVMNRALFSKSRGKYLEESQILCAGFIYLGNYILFIKSRVRQV